MSFYPEKKNPPPDGVRDAQTHTSRVLGRLLRSESDVTSLQAMAGGEARTLDHWPETRSNFDGAVADGPKSCKTHYAEHLLEYNINLFGQVGNLNFPGLWNYLAPDYTAYYEPAKEALIPPDGNGALVPQPSPWWLNDAENARLADQNVFIPGNPGANEAKTNWGVPFHIVDGSQFVEFPNLSIPLVHSVTGNLIPLQNFPGPFGFRFPFLHQRRFVRWGWRQDLYQAPQEGTWWKLLKKCRSRVTKVLLVGRYSAVVRIDPITVEPTTQNVNPYHGGELQFNAALACVAGGSEEDAARVFLAGTGGQVMGAEVSETVTWPDHLDYGPPNTRFGFSHLNEEFEVDITALLKETPITSTLYWGVKMTPPFVPLSYEVAYFPNRTDAAGLVGLQHYYEYAITQVSLVIEE